VLASERRERHYGCVTDVPADLTRRVQDAFELLRQADTEPQSEPEDVEGLEPIEGIESDLEAPAHAQGAPEAPEELEEPDSPTPDDAVREPSAEDEATFPLAPPAPPVELEVSESPEPAPELSVQESPESEAAAGRRADLNLPEGSFEPEKVIPPPPRVLAIANQKGGVGKTTTAVNLGAGLAELGYRVLVVDLDPQGNATTGLGIQSRNLQTSIYDALMGDTPLDDCIEPTSLRNLFVAPATIDLAGAEIELVPAFSRELRLRRALGTIAGEFDFTLIDCPPSLGLLTVNGLAAADEVVVPIQCEYYALEGLGQLMRNVQLVQSNLNPRLNLSTIILTMYDARTKLADQVTKEVRAHFGARVCRNVVPRTVRLSEAPSFGQPITVFDPTSRGAIAYRELAREVSGGAPKRTG